jgi:hypothetical protein
MTEYERFGLVFTKTRVYNSGTVKKTTKKQERNADITFILHEAEVSKQIANPPKV